jgi:hypothetical protein
MARLWLVGTACVLAGAGMGWAFHGAGSGAVDESGDQPRARVAQLVLPQPQPAASSEIDLAQLRAVVREELAASRSQGAATQSAGPAAKQNAPASPELVAQRREAMQDIQTMIASGQWGNAERVQFQQKLSMLDPDQARQALQQVLIGLNNGSIQTETKMPL